MTSPFTLVLILGVIAVAVGQAVGIWLWQRGYAGVVAMTVLGVFLPSGVFAQHGPGRHG